MNENGHARPWLLYFASRSSGRCRRVDGYLAQVLQHGGNHQTFRLFRVEADSRPDLFERFGVTRPPALIVVDGLRVRARLDEPRGPRNIEELLRPWLRPPATHLAQGRPDRHQSRMGH